MRSRELGALLRLAGPLILGYAGMQVMTLVDTAMVGRLGATALAGVGIGNGLYFTLSSVGLGAVIGMDAPVAQAFGAGDRVRARRLLWQGVRMALWASLPLVVVLAAAPLLLPAAGVEPGTSDAVRRYLWARLPNLVPYLVFNAQRSYLQARGDTRPIVVATVVGNVANFVGNYLLIYTAGLGVAGSGLSSTLASAAMVAMTGRAIAALEAPPDPARRARDAQMLRSIRRLGIPVGLQMLAETGVFSTVGVLAGRLGARPAAAHQIGIALASFTFCVTIGIGAAAAVRVGHHVGAGDRAAARHAGLLALGASTLFMSGSALTFLAFGEPLARSLTDDPSVVLAALPIVHIAALFQISDGLQATAAGALRGAGDPHAPLYANLAGHWVVALPVAVALGFGAHMGAPGLWWGLSLGLTVVAGGLIVRFLQISARPIARV